ncbi:MAG: hypothetical protein HOC23_02275 [Halieaceae bacterium]|jgi:hypothetical protein|nr:hypothetical protein [Halieaceae bacterium]
MSRQRHVSSHSCSRSSYKFSLSCMLACALFTFFPFVHASSSIIFTESERFRYEALDGQVLHLSCYTTMTDEKQLATTKVAQLINGTLVWLIPDVSDTLERITLQIEELIDLKPPNYEKRVSNKNRQRDDLERGDAGCGQTLGVSTDRAEIGTNVSWVSSYASQLVFVDGFKRSRTWIPNNYPRDDSWDSGVVIPMSPNGYPTEIPFYPGGGLPAQIVTTIMYDEIDGHYPAGNYTLTFQGTGTIALFGDTEDLIFNDGGSYQVAVDPRQKEGVFLEILESSPSDPIHDIHFIMPGYENTHEESPFYPQFINRLRPFSPLRFAQMLQINGGDYPCDNLVNATDGSCSKGWSSRRKTTDQSQGNNRGVAYEYIIQIANEANSDLWLNIQHGATDEHMRELAKLVRATLKSNLNIYLELSNEVWNGSGPYPQYQWAIDNGLTLGLDADPMLAGGKFLVQRSLEMVKIFNDEFAGDEARLIPLVAGFVAIPDLNESMMAAMSDPAINPHGVTIKALALGAYFGGEVLNEAAYNGLEDSITVTEILKQARDSITRDRPDYEDPSYQNHSLQYYIQRSKAVADRYDLDLITYEGGQHIVQSSGWDANEFLGTKGVRANRDARMYDAYRELLSMWTTESGGGLFVHYSFVLKPSPLWGSFGALEFMGQSSAKAHKFRALRDYMSGQ